MKISQIQIPQNNQKNKLYRLFEILPGLLSWTILLLPFLLSFINIRLMATIMIAYLLLWFIKAVGLNIRAVQGWKIVKQHEKIDWNALIDDLKIKNAEINSKFPDWHYKNKIRINENPNNINSDEVVHAVIIATWNEAREILKPTLDNVANSSFDPKRMIVILAYEDRGGPAVEEQAIKIMKEYEKVFLVSKAVKHIDAPGEVIGKGGNITYSGRELAKIVAGMNLDPKNVLVTTLDADNRPHPAYFANLTYVYSVCHDPKYMSFQPIPMFTNNIWDAPAPMRVIATGNSYWMMIQALRQHMLRNFSSHAQSLEALIETDFWAVNTIVEDGHQFWRSYFKFDGKDEVIPIFVPI